MVVNRYANIPVHLTAWLVVIVVTAALIGLLAVPARAGGPAQVLYGADGAVGNPATNLYILDPATGGIVTTVGPIGFAVTGLAVHPTTGFLYGTTSNRSPTSPGFLIAINQTTGAGVAIGDLVAGDETAADITFGADGTLYGWLEADTDDLVTIDLLTGAATVVGDSGLSTAGSGLAGIGNPLILFGEGDDACASLIDTGTGAVSDPCVFTLNSTFNGEIAAADFDAGGVLYGADLTGSGTQPRLAQLVTINTTTGAVTVLGDSVNSLDAIAFSLAAPEPTPVPSLPNAATGEPSGAADSGPWLWAAGLLFVIAAAGLTFVRAEARIRRR
jgi:DNA-binding beta-propeller fold protein YncE